MDNPTRSRIDCFSFPLEHEALEVLAVWQSHHRPEFARIRASFTDLRLALGSKHPGPKTLKLNRVLTYWEGLMLQECDKVTYDLVPTLQEGYGTFTTIHDYKEATSSLARHANNHRRLCAYYNTTS